MLFSLLSVTVSFDAIPVISNCSGLFTEPRPLGTAIMAFGMCVVFMSLFLPYVFSLNITRLLNCECCVLTINKQKEVMVCLKFNNLRL